MSKRFNPRTLDPSQIPPEWDDVDRDLAERLRPDKYGLRTKEQQKQIDKIRAARWLLLRNDHKARCGRCGAIHEYITRFCIERPFNTLHEIQLFELQQAREQGLVRGENLIVNSANVRGMQLGEPVPISRKQAQKLMLRIRVRGGRDAI
jgi:hypothetical protein